MTVELVTGDCLSVLQIMPENSVDSIVTDPPYGLSFMGKKWDYDVPSVAVWRECLRVLKPGGHLLAFAGTRTQHRMATAIEDAGFEIRDMIAWVYGSGFPKSLDISKAIDGELGADREVIGIRHAEKYPNGPGGNGFHGGPNRPPDGSRSAPQAETAPATDAARQWQGWGTALKPAMEPITVARKPLVGTVAVNVLAHGTGGLNIDGCRVNFVNDGGRKESTGKNQHADFGTKPLTGNVAYGDYSMVAPKNYQPQGRWPANLIHDGSEEVVALFPDVSGGKGSGLTSTPSRGTVGVSNMNNSTLGINRVGYEDNGSAARFFYCAKASRSDRDDGLDSIIARKRDESRKEGLPGSDNPYNRGVQPRANHHPTVKPTDLMRYLVRLVTPPGGTVLDPFMGSGSTGKAAVLEGFSFIGIDRDPDYCELARLRIDAAASIPELTPPAQPELFPL